MYETVWPDAHDAPPQAASRGGETSGSVLPDAWLPLDVDLLRPEDVIWVGIVLLAPMLLVLAIG